MTTGSVVDTIVTLFATRGATEYLGEPVSVAEHMLQAAHLADLDAAPAATVLAALLHDVGHLLADEQTTSDARHDEVGATFLAPYFPDEVTEPIRLHVAAKRFLVAVDASYLAGLSAASVASLELQGGPYRAPEVERFERERYATDAVRVRHYDDLAKTPGRTTPGIEHYRTRLDAAQTR